MREKHKRDKKGDQQAIFDTACLLSPFSMFFGAKVTVFFALSVVPGVLPGLAAFPEEPPPPPPAFFPPFLGGVRKEPSGGGMEAAASAGEAGEASAPSAEGDPFFFFFFFLSDDDSGVALCVIKART